MNKRTTAVIAGSIAVAGSFFLFFQAIAFSGSQQDKQPTPVLMFRKSQEQTGKDSPFGILQAYESAEVLRDKPKPETFTYLHGLVKDIGISWVRWGASPHKTILSDEVLRKRLRDEGVHVVVDLPASREFSDAEIRKRVPPLLENSKDTVQYWQMGNEPNLRNMQGFTRPVEYVRKMKMLHGIVKGIDPEAKILMGGLGVKIGAGDLDEFEYLREVLRQGGGKYFDIFDFHFFGESDNYVMAKEKYSRFKAIFREFGIDKPVWITETSTYTGTPSGGKRSQDEKAQALELVKRYVYFLSLGIEKVFWNSLVEWKRWGERNGAGSGNGYFDHVGLVYDGVGEEEKQKGITFGTKKLSYYSYKKLVETLDGSDWNNREAVKESLNDAYGIFVYRFMKNWKPVYVCWFDCFDEPECSRMKIDLRAELIFDKDVKTFKITEAVPKYKSGKEVADYSTAFNSEIKSSDGGKVIITLKETPVFVEALK